MKYKLLKMYFHTGVHIGNGMLTDGNSVIYADTLFSALCHEALLLPDGVGRLYQVFQQGRLRISDAMPYVRDNYYVPRPMIVIQSEEGDSKKKKAFKKLKYIPIQKMDQYVKAKLDAEKEVDEYSGFAAYEMRTGANITREDDAKPFHVGVCHFKEGCGLYVCIGYTEEDDLEYLLTLFESLGFTGIGGKKSAGLGKFSIMPENCPNEFCDRFDNQHSYDTYMSLSLTLPKEDEMEAVCEGANYLLKKRSGFVASNTYSLEFQKKKTIYMFDSGSIFRHQFEGDIYDVSNKNSHPVYRYAYPFFMGVTEV